MKTNYIQIAFNHFVMISYQNLHDKFGFGQKRILKFYSAMQELLNQYDLGTLNTSMLLKYSVKVKVDSYGWVKSLPTSQKLSLVNFKPNKNNGMNAVKLIESALLISDLLAVSVLKEEFGMSKAKIDEFNEWQKYYIDSYVKGYLNDTMVNELMIAECKIDIIDYMERMAV